MATLTFPLSRIEGHARVVIEVWGGEVQAAYFQATGIRGFEHLVQGTPAEQMPVITPRDGEGHGLVEAPRGPLIHYYRIENGLIAAAEFVIPTVHNTLAIERALRVVAQCYINTERVDMELGRAVGWVGRAFAPCIACATH